MASQVEYCTATLSNSSKPVSVLGKRKRDEVSCIFNKLPINIETRKGRATSEPPQIPVNANLPESIDQRERKRSRSTSADQSLSPASRSGVDEQCYSVGSEKATQSGDRTDCSGKPSDSVMEHETSQALLDLLGEGTGDLDEEVIPTAIPACRSTNLPQWMVEKLEDEEEKKKAEEAAKKPIQLNDTEQVGTQESIVHCPNESNTRWGKQPDQINNLHAGSYLLGSRVADSDASVGVQVPNDAVRSGLAGVSDWTKTSSTTAAAAPSHTCMRKRDCSHLDTLENTTLLKRSRIDHSQKDFHEDDRFWAFWQRSAMWEPDRKYKDFSTPKTTLDRVDKSVHMMFHSIKHASIEIHESIGVKGQSTFTWSDNPGKKLTAMYKKVFSLSTGRGWKSIATEMKLKGRMTSHEFLIALLGAWISTEVFEAPCPWRTPYEIFEEFGDVQESAVDELLDGYGVEVLQYIRYLKTNSIKKESFQEDIAAKVTEYCDDFMQTICPHIDTMIATISQEDALNTRSSVSSWFKNIETVCRRVLFHALPLRVKMAFSSDLYEAEWIPNGEPRDDKKMREWFMEDGELEHKDDAQVAFTMFPVIWQRTSHSRKIRRKTVASRAKINYDRPVVRGKLAIIP